MTTGKTALLKHASILSLRDESKQQTNKEKADKPREKRCRLVCANVCAKRLRAAAKTLKSDLVQPLRLTFLDTVFLWKTILSLFVLDGGRNCLRVRRRWQGSGRVDCADPTRVEQRTKE